MSNNPTIQRVTSTLVVGVTPTISNSAYTSGNQFGGIQTLTDAARIPFVGDAILQSITIVDPAKVDANFDILFFNASPTLTSSDNTAISISDAEMVGKCIGMVSISGGYTDLAANSVVSLAGIGLALQALTNDSNLYAVVIIRSGVTFGSANAPKFIYGFLQD